MSAVTTSRDTGLQRLLALLLVDERALELFRLMPDRLVDEYGLTVSQVDALRGLDATRLDFTALTVRTKRESRLEHRFPLTSSLLRAAGRLEEVLHAYALEALPIRWHEESRLLTEAQRFAAFVGGLSLPDVPACLPDLAHYELLRLELSAAAGREAPQAAGVGPGLDGDGLAATVPVLADNVRVGSFAYDVPALAERLRDGPCVPRVEEHPTCLVLAESASESSFVVYRVAPEVLAVLSRCDGASTFGEIASTPLGGPPAASILRACVERGMVRLHRQRP